MGDHVGTVRAARCAGVPAHSGYAMIFSRASYGTARLSLKRELFIFEWQGELQDSGTLLL